MVINIHIVDSVSRSIGIEVNYRKSKATYLPRQFQTWVLAYHYMAGVNETNCLTALLVSCDNPLK